MAMRSASCAWSSEMEWLRSEAVCRAWELAFEDWWVRVAFGTRWFGGMHVAGKSMCPGSRRALLGWRVWLYRGRFLVFAGRLYRWLDTKNERRIGYAPFFSLSRSFSCHYSDSRSVNHRLSRSRSSTYKCHSQNFVSSSIFDA